MAGTSVHFFIFFAFVTLVSCQSNPCAPNPCQNGADCFEAKLSPGYICLCDGDWMGQDCEVPDIFSASSRVRCSQNFYLDQSGNITSPGWPNFYSVREFCLYKIKIPTADSIRLDVVFFDSERYKDELYMIPGPLFPGFNDPRIRSLNGSVQDGTRNFPPLLFNTNQVTMLWESDFNINRTGFLLTYNADLDNCWRNQCTDGSVCLELRDETGYSCLCPPGRGGRFCESGIVIVAETRPSPTFPAGNLVEGISSILIFFDLALTPSQNSSFRVVGSNLWHVTVSLSGQSDRGGDFVSFVPLLSTTQGSVAWSPPFITTLTGIQTLFQIDGFVCADTQFLCATINKSASADFEIIGDPTDASLTGCAQIPCRGVEISATSILGLSPVNIQDGGIQTFQFDVALDSVAGAGSVRGNSLWLVTAFASSSSDGSVRVGEQQRILLSADVSGTSIFAGSRSILENLVVTLNFQNLNCAQLRYFCVEVMRNPDGTPFTLTGVPNDDVLTTCQELNCGAVQIIRTSYTSNNPTVLLANSASNVINVDLTAFSLGSSGAVSGSNLWQVDIFTNQQINGGGQTAVTQLATLSVSAANAALLQGGGSILLRNVEANLDLTGVACSQIPYICTRLRRNPASQPEFTLQGIPSDSVFISCQGFQCSDRRTCADIICRNGATCIDDNQDPVCICTDGWMGPLCANPVNACNGVVCLFGGTCIDNQFDFFCQCTLGRTGRNCELEDAGVTVVSVTPVIQSGSIREGFFLNPLNLDVMIRTDANGDSVSGTGLWDVEFFLSARMDGAGTRYDLQTSALTSVQSSTAITAGSTASITEIFSTVDLRSLTCPQVPYICVELSKGSSPFPDFLLTGSLIGCTEIDCQGVEIVNTQLQFNTPPVLLERSTVNPLTFDFLFTSSASGGSVNGNNLWNLVWYLSTEPDDTGTTQVIPITLTPQQSGVDLIAATTGIIRSATALINTSPLSCSEFSYICVRLEKNPSASIDFTLTASDEGALSDCQPVTCRGVEVTRLGTTFTTSQLRSGETNSLMFNLDIFSNPGGASVTGTNLWMVEVFTNTNINGNGNIVATTTATIPGNALNQGINAGVTSTLGDLRANLDLSSATCAEIPFICVRLNRNQFSNPEFTLMNSNGGDDIIQCQPLPCQDPSPCENNICRNGATCVVQNNGFNCMCTAGFIGTFCETVNPCFQTNPCNSNGVCLPLGPGIFVCQCTGGFSGVNCEIPPDPCASSPCLNFGTCVRFQGTSQFSCTCPPFFDGEFCELEDPCRSNPCGSNAQCLGNTQDGTYQCICFAGSKGDACQFPEPCFSSPCLNGGVCSSTSTGSQYTCTCQQGFQGVNCQILDPCVSDPCINGGTCISALNGARFECICPQFIFGGICEFVDPCGSNPCQNNGQCNRDAQGSQYTCDCVGNFIGDNCQFANPCMPQPCLNNGACSIIDNGASFSCSCPDTFLGDICQNQDPCLSGQCQNGATCRTTSDGSAFICDCSSGFFGLTCGSSSICATVPCRNGGTCTPNAQGTSFTCTCPPGFLLPDCRIRDACTFNPCQNSGTCISSPDGSYFCICQPNIFGVNCENPDPCQSNPCLGGGTCRVQSQGLFYSCDCPEDTFGLNCQNRDPCSSNPCINGGTCHTSSDLSAYQCVCRAGYVGLNCEILAPCDISPCRSGGTCVSDSTQPTGYRCLCTPGRTGPTCNQVDLCISLSPCSNGATCLPNTEEGTFTCQCAAGFTGQQCQSEIPCFINPCLNGGTCIPSGTGYTCLCQNPFEGINCQFTSLMTPTPMQCTNPSDFPCFSGECISSQQRCDQAINCNDGFSDEIGCPRPCRSQQFACQSGNTCISDFLICDGTAHCQDASDESLPQCFPCQSDPCQNGGICEVGTDQRSYICNCPEGFTGPTCEGIIVTVNDPPQFSSPSDIFIREDTPANTLVFTLEARDVNGDDLQFGLRGDPATSYFFMQDLTSGELYLRRELDREIIGDSFNFTVIVRDDQGAEVEQVITVFLDDVNDNPPVITNLPASIRLPENSPRDEIFQVTATDVDLGLGSVLSYNIESVTLFPAGQDTGNLFAINGATGSIFLTHNLDFETTQQYIINIRVSDLGTPSLSAFGTLTVNVDDVQDLGPLFINLPYDITIPETQQLSSVVQMVMAVDQDVTVPTPVSYSFVIGNEQGYFDLNPSTGVITLARPLDRDDLVAPSSFTLTVRAEEVGSPTNFDFNTFTITVLDVQDEPPSFNQNFYDATIPEDMEMGEVLPLNIFISDSDRTTRDLITLEIEGPADLPFQVSPLTIENEGSLLLSVSGPLDYETTQMYQFMIIARETNPLTGENLSATSTVTVNVQDVNDNDPVYDRASFMGSVTEGSTRGTFVTSVSATDLDSNQNALISYSIVQGNEQNLFRIDSSSGVITTQSPTIDFETSQMSYRLVVEATNPTPPVAPATGSSLVDVFIDILDVNDNSPFFAQTNYNTSVTEIAEPGFSIIRVSATDLDSGAGGDVRYSINGGNADGHFEIDELTGDVTLRTPVDREIREFYSLTIVATDQTEPFNIGLTTVDIYVRDFNDNDPIWRQTNYNADLSEGSQPDTFVVRVQADDLDVGPNSMLTYSLSPSNPLFRIDPETGEIFLVGALDRETLDEIMLTVLVTDNGNPNRPASSPAFVTVTVTDVNDNAPTFLDDPYDFSVEENQQANILVGQVLATDVDQLGMQTFSFVSDVPGFIINPTTGEIFTTQVFDREVQSFYTFQVVVFDGVAMDFATVNVTITDVNDADPIFDLSEYSATVPEDFPLLMEILSVSATDVDQGDGNDITFRFESQRNVEGPFTIDINTGLLEISSPLDFEDQSMYSLTVLAVDTSVGGIQRTGTTTIIINVTDVNDNGPRFTRNPYPEESVPENIGEGVPIVQVSTTDEDTEENSGVMYQIVQGNVGGVFTVNENGIISRGPTPLDRETLDFYLLVLEAFDPSNPELPRDTTVATIRLTDVNDVIPEFTQSVYTRLDLTEDVEIGTRVVEVQARDLDLLEAGMVRYSIAAGDDQGFFDIDSFTGEIRTVSLFPSITATMTFNLTVQAIDQSSPFNVGTAYVLVDILDAGEIPPVFVLPRYEADSIENLEAGTFVVQVQALVEGRPANLRYSLDPNAHPDVMMHFAINETTGEITIRSPLDRETTDFFAFTVFAEGETISSSTAVWVTVLDANDNVPMYLEFPEDVTIPEGSPAQTIIGDIRTSDLDINRNAEVNYRISDGNREGAFTLRVTNDRVSIITTRPLNREFTDEYNITVTAFDSGEPSLESSQTVRVTVGDTNDNAPLFTTSSFSGSIVENFLSSLPVATLEVTDSDDPSTNNLIFSIVQGNDEGKFTVNSRGEVTLTSALDRENVESYQLTVRLQDPTYDPQYQAFVPVYITVLDENDNTPVFSQDSYEAEVGEGLSSVIVTTVSATDRDLGANSEIRFNVTGPNSELFSIDPIQGHLVTDIELDRELQDEYIVTITATDQAIDPMDRLTATTTVAVSITDINDSPPTFTADRYGPYFILEESPNAFIDTIQAMDPDLGSGGMVTLSIIGEFRDYFTLNPSTGLLTVNRNRPLDYEEQQQINVTIVARDAEGLQSTREITVNVVNINDNSPRFEGAPYTFTISENVTVGTLAFIAAATDADLGPPGVVTYSVVDGNTGDVFWINPDNGEIYVNKTLDRETLASYSLVLEARDNPENEDDTRTTTTRLTITVSDADDVPPAFPSDRYFGTILENSFIGTLVSMDRPIRAVDSDEVSVVMYEIIGEDSAAFVIDPLSGELRSSEVFDREVKSLYTFTVIASDSQGSSATADVNITILDVNDNEPSLDLSEYNYTIPENAVGGFLVGQLTASDGDGQTVRFSIVTGAEDKFVIDPENGWISVAPRAVLDREETPSYTLTVSVTDQGSPQLTTSGTVVIDLSDINDSPPVFGETDFTVEVSESEMGRTINVFQAGDPDLDAMIQYLIDSIVVLDQNGRDISSEIDSSAWFQIDALTGELTLVEPIDREVVREVNVVISATDVNGVDEQTRMSNPNAEVQILITDTNDNGPVINPIGIDMIQEESSVGTIITTVTANDPDQGDAGSVTFSILNGDDLPVSIDPMTGVLTISRVIDREDLSWVNFTIIAADGGSPSLNGTLDVNLRVRDINDNNPAFSQQSYSASVNESTPAGECFTFVTASDADDGNFGAVTYTLSGGDNLFQISSETGEVCLLGMLDRETVNQYTLIITAKDNPAGSSNNRRETSTTLVVDVTDTNEFSPMADPEFPFDLPEGEPPGTVVGVITAVDPDSPDDPLIYVISEIQPPGAENLFTIDNSTGEIILIGQIDSDNASFSDEYRINVIVSDGGNPEMTTNVVSVITITDLNDTPPSFVQSYYNITVSENFDTKNPVVMLSASDPDEGDVITYMIIQGNDDSSFLISSDTGEIRFLGTFDHETQQTYQLTISARDRAGLESTAVVDIYVTDLNDNAPRFTRPLYNFFVCENEPEGFEVGTIVALDNDLSLNNNDILYSILTGNENGSLRLDPMTGVITTTREFDYELEQGFTLTVEARNHRIQDGPISDTSVVTLDILDKNDNSPQFGRTEYSQSILETETGTVEAIFATDRDSGANGIISYRIVDGNALGLFSIRERDGLLTIDRPVSSLADPIFEFQLVVEAVDMGNPSRSSNVTVFISVGDENDRAPVFWVPQPGETLQLPENEPPGYLIVCLNATDRDLGGNGEILYDFFTSTTGDGDYLLFTLNRTSGKLYANFTADRETRSMYTLVVLASDQGSPPRATPLQIIIEVTDKADTDPTFPTENGLPSQQIVAPVEEGASTLTVIGNVTRAVDPDVNSTIYYFIVAGNDDGLFEINPMTGQIILVGELDHEQQPRHTLVVKATNDGGFDPADGGPYDPSTDNTLKEVVVNVLDVNDNPHVFLDSLIVTGVPRESPVDSVVIRINVRDADASSADNIMYRIVRAVFNTSNGNINPASGLFYIDETTGTIRTSTTFVESDLNGFFVLDVEAVDTETGVVAETQVQVYVLESDQRLVLVIMDSVTNVREKEDILRELLSNITGGIVRIDDITAVTDDNGNRIGQTMVFFHVIDRETNQIVDSGTVIRVIDERNDSIQRLFIGNGVIDVYPVTSGGTVGGIGWLGALLLALALLLFLGALLFIILLCCLPGWSKLIGGGGAAAAAGGGGAAAAGKYNNGYDDTDNAKEYEYQEGIVNFEWEDMNYVDTAQDALILTSLKGAKRENYAYGDGSSYTGNGVAIHGGGIQNGSYYSEERHSSATVGTLNRDGSVSVMPEDGMQETSFIETREHSQHQRRAERLSHSEPITTGYSRMVTNQIDREALRKQTAAEIRAMLNHRNAEETSSQYSSSTARFDNMNRSITVNVGYDHEDQDYNRSLASSRQGSLYRGGEAEAVVNVGYDNDSLSNSMNHVTTYRGNKQYLDPMSDFGDHSSFHEERTTKEYEEDDMMVSEERHVTRSSSHRVYQEEPKPKQREVVDEIFIINGEEPFPVSGRDSARSGVNSIHYGEGRGSIGDGHSVTSRTLSTHSDEDLRHYNVNTMSTTRGDGWSSITDFDNIDEGDEDIIEERRTIKKRTLQRGYGPEGGFNEVANSGF